MQFSEAKFCYTMRSAPTVGTSTHINNKQNSASLEWLTSKFSFTEFYLILIFSFYFSTLESSFVCSNVKKRNAREYFNLLQGGYFDGIRSHLGGLTQRVKSWYWGRPLVSANYWNQKKKEKQKKIYIFLIFSLF